MSEVKKLTVVEEARMAEELIRHYRKVSEFLEVETIFRARPLRITIDGPFSIGGGFEVAAAPGVTPSVPSPLP